MPRGASPEARQLVRAKAVAARLDELFPTPEIPLDHSSPFTLLVAVILSAQCTDKRVNEVTPKLFALADTPSEMRKLSAKRIEEIIRPCGLGPQKARAIRNLSEQLIREHGGQVPKSREDLEALPGVGRKTASVVLVQAFGTPAFPVDTHIHRLAARWGLSSGKSVATTERDLTRVFPDDSWGKVHLQMVLCGRSYCPARGHASAECPMCREFGAAAPQEIKGQRAAAARPR